MAPYTCPECHHHPSGRVGGAGRQCHCRCHDAADATADELARVTALADEYRRANASLRHDLRESCVRAAQAEARCDALHQTVCDFQAAALLGADPEGVTPAEVESQVQELRRQRDALLAALNGGVGAQPGAMHANLTYYAAQLERTDGELDSREAGLMADTLREYAATISVALARGEGRAGG